MLALALLALHPAPIEDWQVIATADNGIIYSLDRDSVRDMGGYREAWTKTDYSNVLEGDVSLRRSREDYDCAGRRMRARQTVAYNRDGKIFRTMSLTEAESEWKAVTPDTMGEAKFEAVCGAPVKP